MREHPILRPRRRRLLLLVSFAALLVAGVWYLAVRDPGPAPVRGTTLEATGWQKRIVGRNWRDLPFAIDPVEEAAVAECARLAGRAESSLNDELAFDRDDTRADLQQVLARHPNLFAAEHLLATWHHRRGNRSEASRYFGAAEAHAPAILVQTYRDEDGRPLVGALIRDFEVECNRVHRGSLDPSLKLRYALLVTDEDGTIRLPVYRTVWRITRQSHPDGHDAVIPTMGWFESRGKVGLLPVVTLRPKQ